MESLWAFSFDEATATSVSYLDVLQQWLFPQLPKDEPDNFVWLQHGAPPRRHNSVRDWLNSVSSNSWIGSQGPNDRDSFAWPSRSPDLTRCDFYLWGFIKDNNYMPLLPAGIPDLRNRVQEVMASITPDTLIKKVRTTLLWTRFVLCVKWC